MKFLNIIHAYNKKKMFKSYKKIINYFLGFIDILLSLAVFYGSFLLINNYFPGEKTIFTNHYLILLVLLVPTIYLLLETTNLARVPRTSRYISIFFDFVRFSIAMLLVSLFFILVLRLKSVDLRVVFLFVALDTFVLYLVRIFTFKFFKYFRANGHNTNNVIVIADDSSEPIIEKILNRKEWGFQILMILTDSKRIMEKYAGEIKVIPNKIDIKVLIDNDIVDEVIYCSNDISNENVNKLVGLCEEIGVVFRFQSDLISENGKGFVADLEGIPMLTYMNVPSNQIEVAWKTLTESIFSFLVLIMISPIIFLVGLAIKLDSKGPIFFKQKRVGLRGRQFYLFKFRTMVVNAEEIKAKLMAQNESDGPTFKIKKDPRITSLGRFLRKTSLDELPQLFNVLRGEMALIGPRPPLPDEVKKYERWQLRRLSVKPGLTCTWQIIPNRNDVLFEKWMKLDMQYIDTWSLKNDITLFFKTIKAVFSFGGY